MGSGGKAATAPKASPNPAPADLVRASAAGAPAGRLVERDALEACVKTTDPNAVLEDEVADAMHLLLDDFVDELIRNSVEVGKGRYYKCFRGTKCRCWDVKKPRRAIVWWPKTFFD